MKKVLILPLFMMILLDCSPQPIREEVPIPVRYLALGDSYTMGEGVSEKERWPNQLADRLREKGHLVDVTIVAHSGWTTFELGEGIRAARPQGAYDLVSLLIGTNNQHRGRDIENYRIQFQVLLDQAIVFANGNPSSVLVLSIPDWSVTPFAMGMDRAQISAEIDEYNAINRALSEQAGVRYVDITSASRRASDNPSLLVADGLHPSGVLYATWVELILPEAILALSK